HRTKTVLAEAFERIADRSDEPGLQVGLASEWVAQLTRERVVCHRVHGEVAPLQILIKATDEVDRIRPSAIGVGALAPKRSDFNRFALAVAAFDEDRHRAVLLSGWNDPLAPKGAHHLLRMRAGGQVKIRFRRARAQPI